MLYKLSISQIVFMTVLFCWILCDCEYGWFGKDCIYKCRCPNMKCKDSGECINDELCTENWFGLSCQYKDEITTNGWEHIDWIGDGDPYTCNPNNQETLVELTFKEPFYFTWMRVYIAQTNVSNDLLIMFNNKTQTCDNKRTFYVSMSSVDIMCQVSVDVNHMTIRGFAVGYLCGLQISGGRNLALKQATNQSSTKYKSWKAVDGSAANTPSPEGSCSQTAVLDPQPTFSLFYQRPAILYRAVIYNKNDNKDEMKFFVIRTYSANGTLIETYTEPGHAHAVYHVIFKQKSVKISWLTVSVNQTLTICEIATYGDYACQDDTWGLDCSRKCSCKTNQRCSDITGKCSRGCPVGFYGTECSTVCNTDCGSLGCTDTTGDCLNCNNGYYGNNCSTPCPINCFNKTCHFKNATCLSCSDGFYGDQCTTKCSLKCQKQMCHGSNGACFSCEDGNYGENCSIRCPNTCQDQICHFENGSCFTCIGGLFGQLCQYPCPSNCKDSICSRNRGNCVLGSVTEEESQSSSRVPLFIGIIMCIIFVCFMLSKKARRHSDSQKEQRKRKHKSRKPKSRKASLKTEVAEVKDEKTLEEAGIEEEEEEEDDDDDEDEDAVESR